MTQETGDEFVKRWENDPSAAVSVTPEFGAGHVEAPSLDHFVASAFSFEVRRRGERIS